MSIRFPPTRSLSSSEVPSALTRPASTTANRIAVVDAGRVIAEGTSDELKDRVGGNRIDIAVAKDADLVRAAEVARRHFSSEVTVDPAQRRISAPSKNGTSQLAGLVRDFDGAGIDIVDLQLHRPSLDDVFLTLTGHQAEEEKAAAPTGRWQRRSRRWPPTRRAPPRESATHPSRDVPPSSGGFWVRFVSCDR